MGNWNSNHSHPLPLASSLKSPWEGLLLWLIVVKSVFEKWVKFSFSSQFWIFFQFRMWITYLFIMVLCVHVPSHLLVCGTLGDWHVTHPHVVHCAPVSAHCTVNGAEYIKYKLTKLWHFTSQWLFFPNAFSLSSMLQQFCHYHSVLDQVLGIWGFRHTLRTRDLEFINIKHFVSSWVPATLLGFRYILPLGLHKNPWRQVILLFTVYKWGNWGLRSNFAKATGGGAGILAPAGHLQAHSEKSTHTTTCCVLSIHKEFLKCHQISKNWNASMGTLFG